MNYQLVQNKLILFNFLSNGMSKQQMVITKNVSLSIHNETRDIMNKTHNNALMKYNHTFVDY